MTLCCSVFCDVLFRRKWALSLQPPTFWRTWSPSLPIPSSLLLRASTELGHIPTSCPSIRHKLVGPTCKNWVWMCVWQRKKSFHFDNAKKSTDQITRMHYRCSLMLKDWAVIILLFALSKRNQAESEPWPDLGFDISASNSFMVHMVHISANLDPQCNSRKVFSYVCGQTGVYEVRSQRVVDIDELPSWMTVLMVDCKYKSIIGRYVCVLNVVSVFRITSL